MTKKKNKMKHRPGKQKGKSELIAHEQNKKAKKEKVKKMAFSKSGKKDGGLPFKENSTRPHLKKLDQPKGEEKLQRREAFELQRQQAREKALEDKRIRVILFSLNPN
jgi:hypothetical protein